MLPQWFAFLGTCCVLSFTSSSGACLDDACDPLMDESAFVQSVLQIHDHSSEVPEGGLLPNIESEKPKDLVQFAMDMFKSVAEAAHGADDRGKLLAFNGDTAMRKKKGLKFSFTTESGDGSSIILGFDHGCTSTGDMSKTCRFLPGDTIESVGAALFKNEVRWEAMRNITFQLNLRGVMKTLLSNVVSSKPFTVMCRACGEGCDYKLPKVLHKTVKDAAIKHLIYKTTCPIQKGPLVFAHEKIKLNSLEEIGMLDFDSVLTEEMRHKDGRLIYRAIVTASTENREENEETENREESEGAEHMEEIEGIV